MCQLKNVQQTTEKKTTLNFNLISVQQYIYNSFCLCYKRLKKLNKIRSIRQERKEWVSEREWEREWRKVVDNLHLIEAKSSGKLCWKSTATI